MNRTKSAHMDRMSVIDTVWLLGDEPLPGEPHIPAQVGVLGLFRGQAPSFDEFLARFTRGFERVPRMRHRVLRFPFDLFRPMWIDDVKFDIHRHIQVAEYTGDVTYEGLQKFLEGLTYDPPFDRAHPLWKIWLVPRLDDGRWGLVFSMHHAAADGLGLMELQPTFMDATPGGDAPTPKLTVGATWSPASTPGLLAHAGKVLGDARALLAGWLAALRQARSDAAGTGRRLRALVQQVLLIARNRPESWKCQPLPELSGRRSGPPANALVKLPLPELLRAKDELGGTVTSVYLAGLAIGIGRWLTRRGVDTSSLTLRVAVPISFRGDSGRELGNEVGGMWISLPVWEMSSARRVAMIGESIAKQQGLAKAGWSVMRFVNLMPGFTMRGVMERTSRPEWFNFGASAIRGPERPYYMFGAPLEEVLSAGYLPPHNRLAIAMSSYHGAVRCAAMMDREAIPDYEELNQDLARGFSELLDEAGCDGGTVSHGAVAAGLPATEPQPEGLLTAP